MKRVWNKLKIGPHFILAISMLCAIFGGISISYALYYKLILSGVLSSCLFILSFCLYRINLILANKKTLELKLEIYEFENKKLLEQFNDAIEVCKRWEKYSANQAKESQDSLEKIKQSYIANVNTVVEIVAEGGELLPQQVAMLSNLTNNMVQASTIKVLLETSKQIDNTHTLMMVQVDHEKANWSVKITGRSIELEQALQIIDRVKQKLSKIAEKSTLIRKTKKIQN